MQELTIKGQIELLESLGISGVTAEKVEEIQNSWNDMPEEIRGSLDMTASILTDIGSGNYDYEEETWTPESDCVFSFDAEIYDVSSMFTNVLAGIQAISSPEISITDVKETSEVIDENDGTSKQTVQFILNGYSYTYTAEIDGGWFDAAFLEFYNQILESEKNKKKLFVTSDGYQELILFYNTEEWAEGFSEKTGLEFE